MSEKVNMRITDLSELETESDVEQKFVYPLLTDASPMGLNIPSADIHTKGDIRQYKIGKGSEEKLYFPDLIIAKAPFPLIVIEVKKPSEGLTEAYREARLYAGELNASFPSQLNPVTFIMATNGKDLIAGPVDQAEPCIDLNFSDLFSYTAAYKSFVDTFSNIALVKIAKKLQKKYPLVKYFMPRKLLGGKAKQDELLPKNAFGETIYRTINQLFIPDSNMRVRAEIAKYAYVTSKNRDRYIDPINKLVRAANPSSIQDATFIEDPKDPRILVNKLYEGRKLEHKVLILIGGPGCGKTTFVDHLREVAIPTELSSKIAWVHFNMNRAPISSQEIYEWVRKEIIHGIRCLYADIDFDTLENLKKLYADYINKFDKGHRDLLSEADYKKELSNLIRELEGDNDKTAQSYCRYCGGDKGNLLIFVLDNCDKRTRDDQLLMFEVAQWLTKEFRVLVILPLREETYDNHYHEPPLDTVLKDLVFRIDPPSFESVLSKRIDLALGKIPSGKLQYNLPNSMQVKYSSAEQGKYLIAIMQSIFYDKNLIGRLIIGLSGGNIRTAFEIFLEICNSSYLSEDEILKVKKFENYHIPYRVMLRVLLRKNRRYYKSKDSHLKNIFFLSLAQGVGSYFYRVLTLLWLKEHSNKLGPTKQVGFFPISALIQSLLPLGLEESVILREVEELAKARCIVTEDFKLVDLETNTLIKIAPAGFIHLELLLDVDYWAAIAEDTKFSEEHLAKKIASRLADSSKYLQLGVACDTALMILDYLIKDFELLRERSASFMSTLDWLDGLALKDIRQTINSKALKLDGWDQFLKSYHEGDYVEVTLARETKYGFFVDFYKGVSGLLPKSACSAHNEKFGAQGLREGRKVKVRLDRFDKEKRHIYLSLAEG